MDNAPRSGSNPLLSDFDLLVRIRNKRRVSRLRYGPYLYLIAVGETALDMIVENMSQSLSILRTDGHDFCA